MVNAVQSGVAAVLAELLSYGPDVNASDEHDRTPLAQATELAAKARKTEIDNPKTTDRDEMVRLLRAAGAVESSR